MANVLACSHFACGDCRSCQWLDKPYLEQLADKQADLKRLLFCDFLQNDDRLLPAVPSPLSQFRNKAKMVVSGSVERPILGISHPQGDETIGIDLCDCPLYPAHFTALFAVLKQFIGRAGLVPYHIQKKRGELKYILLTESQAQRSVLLRFVVRSESKRALVERELPWLLDRLPPHSVVTLNIQPHHSAILEGEQEIFLTTPQRLAENFNGIPLFIRPQGFFQTNPDVARQLYATAQRWVADLPIQQLWDLFCGVGGFGLHCAKALQAKNPQVSLTGIEISPAAIESAKQSAEQLGLDRVHFASLDSAQFACHTAGTPPDLVIVNPPRRGIGQALATYLNQLGSPYLIYSSCNADTMAKDFHSLSDYRIEKVQLFDMFPHTAHYETLVLLIKKPH